MAIITLARPIPFPKDLPAAEREARRRIALAGAGNFRDLGGYAAADGRTVRWGVLYRSDALSKLTRADLAHLARLGLTRVIDFRTDDEKANQPDRLPAGCPIERIAIPIDDAISKSDSGLREKILSGAVDGIDPDERLIGIYTQLGSIFTPQYRQFVRTLLQAHGQPLLFHCAAGKDRAGFAAAITLRLLGVPEATVMRDYLLSGPFTLAAHKIELLLIRLTRGRPAANVVRGLYGAKPAYLEAAFNALLAAYGSFDAYARHGLGLTESDFQQLRTWLLEP